MIQCRQGFLYVALFNAAFDQISYYSEGMEYCDVWFYMALFYAYIITTISKSLL